MISWRSYFDKRTLDKVACNKRVLDDEEVDLLDQIDALNGWQCNNSWYDFDDEPTRKIDLEKDKDSSKKKCECGAEKVGSGKHSEWCPKYQKESE